MTRRNMVFMIVFLGLNLSANAGGPHKNLFIDTRCSEKIRPLSLQQISLQKPSLQQAPLQKPPLKPEHILTTEPPLKQKFFKRFLNNLKKIFSCTRLQSNKILPFPKVHSLYRPFSSRKAFQKNVYNTQHAGHTPRRPSTPSNSYYNTNYAGHTPYEYSVFSRGRESYSENVESYKEGIHEQTRKP